MFNFIRNAILILTYLTTLMGSPLCAAHSISSSLYAGLMTGYGRTTWDGLVPDINKQNMVLAMSAPIHVDEGGVTWGGFVGYELLPTFAIEAAYMRYADAKVFFDPTSIFTFENDGLSSFTTSTETISLIAKIMMPIPRSKFRAYSSFGVAEVHRFDELKDRWLTRPTFGLGVNYDFTRHMITELGGLFTAGDGQPEITPTSNYFPFLYAVFIKLAYRF